VYSKKMKAVILAGGLGTRISEESQLRPKPMIEIGGKPILWHIMKHLSVSGIDEFIICLGYKGYMIKEFFANYFIHTSDITVDTRNDSIQVHRNSTESWKISLIETGDQTLTGGRLKRIGQFLDDEPFLFTYGDGVSNVDISELTNFHNAHGLDATLTAVQPPGRYGALVMDGLNVVEFKEKPQGDNSWINGGFFVLSPTVLDLIIGDQTSWEEAPLEQLARSGNLAAFKHQGFWQPMDTLRDKNLLESLWNEGNAPWKTW
jgi:glucose-1-phosphate cytidylyltransferase